MISRRQFIAISTLTAVGLAGAVSVYSWWDTPAASPYTKLSEREGKFLSGLSAAAFPAGAAIPLSGGEARLDRFFDELLNTMPEENAVLIKLLLQGLDKTSVFWYGSSFHTLWPWFTARPVPLRRAPESYVDFTP